MNVIVPRFAGEDLRQSLHTVRILTSKGELFECSAPFFDVERGILFVTLPDKSVRQLAPTDVQTIWRRRHRWSALLALALPILTAGAVGGTFLVPGSGVFLGVLVGAFVAPVLSWLLQDLPPFYYWQEVTSDTAA